MSHYHRILEVPADASRDQIRAQYKQLVRIFHPDRFVSASDKEFVEQKLKEINEAYHALLNPDSSKGQLGGNRQAMPQPIVLPSGLDFGDVPYGDEATLVFHVGNTGGMARRFSLNCDEKNTWFRVTRGKRVNPSQPFPMEFAIVANTQALEHGQKYTSWIDVHMDGVVKRIPLSVAVSDKRSMPTFSPRMILLGILFVAILGLAPSIINRELPYFLRSQNPVIAQTPSPTQVETASVLDDESSATTAGSSTLSNSDYGVGASDAANDGVGDTGDGATNSVNNGAGGDDDASTDENDAAALLVDPSETATATITQTSSVTPPPTATAAEAAATSQPTAEDSVGFIRTLLTDIAAEAESSSATTATPVVATNTAAPTAINLPTNTALPLPTSTPLPLPTATSAPIATALPTATDAPTATPQSVAQVSEPSPTSTQIPSPYGVVIRVPDRHQVYVRADISVDSQPLALLDFGAQLAAIGRTYDSAWVLVMLPGAPAGIESWIYAKTVIVDETKLETLPVVIPQSISP